MQHFLDFEGPIAELEGKIRELRHLSGESDLNIVEEVARLQSKVQLLLQQTYARLTPWQLTQVARHPDRPHTLDYVRALVEDYQPLAGDRCFGEDPAMVGGLGRFRSRAVVVLGHEKGRETAERVHRNFGMARPEGYRKAVRLMRLADRFQLPVVSFVDTAGAYPGVGAEQRGQAEAIAQAIRTCLSVGTPIVSVIIGEGGSGGAVAIASADRVLMLENSVYSVISPEGCASILWRTNDQAAAAAEALRLTAADMKDLGVADTVIPEPVGGAHRNPDPVLKAVGRHLESALTALEGKAPRALVAARRRKYIDFRRI